MFKLLWYRLGYEKTANTPVPDIKSGDISFVPVNVNTAAALTLFGWKDRLRLLITGRLHIRVLTYTSVPVNKTHTLINVAVLPPGETGI